MYIYVCWQCYPLVWAFHPRYTQAYWSSFKYFRQTHQHLEADRIEFTDEDVISILLYGSKTWTLLKADERRLEAFHVNCQWRILGIRWFHFVTNAWRRRLSNPDLSEATPFLVTCGDYWKRHQPTPHYASWSVCPHIWLNRCRAKLCL